MSNLHLPPLVAINFLRMTFLTINMSICFLVENPYKAFPSFGPKSKGSVPLNCITCNGSIFGPKDSLTRRLQMGKAWKSFLGKSGVSFQASSVAYRVMVL